MAYKSIVRPLLFKLDAERVHGWVAELLRFFPVSHRVSDSRLATTVAGISFSTPLGLAAGFDKDAEFFPHIYKFGFGCVEVGTITPKAQAGNSGVRIFRLPKQSGIINRMGFPNDGVSRALSRIRRARMKRDILGVNVGANRDSNDKIADYVFGYKAVSAYCDYVTINVSSPNTAGLRQLETGDQLRSLLSALRAEMKTCATPIFLKVSPDLTATQIDQTCAAIEEFEISGVIVGNTTIQRPPGTDIGQEGGLSGGPLSSISESALKLFSHRLQGRVPIISVGGISTAEQAYHRIRLGASLVQIYSSFVYEGHTLAKTINDGLIELLAKDGFANVEQAVGVGLSRSPRTPPGLFPPEPARQLYTPALVS